MNAIYASLICVAGALICCILRPTRPELATGVALAAGTAALMTGMGDLRQAVGQVSQIAQTAGLESAHWQTLMKACGLSLIGEFAGQICADAGESALAGRIRSPAVSFSPISTCRVRSISPVSMPGSVSMVVTPETVSPSRMHQLMGAAPLYLGRRDA